VSASGNSSEQHQVILAERLSPIQRPDAPTPCEKSGLVGPDLLSATSREQV
jgi:hypothetical protein